MAPVWRNRRLDWGAGNLHRFIAQSKIFEINRVINFLDEITVAVKHQDVVPIHHVLREDEAARPDHNAFRFVIAVSD